MSAPEKPADQRIKTCVLTVSDRCSAGEREDRSGPALATQLPADQFDVTIRVIPDGVESVHSAITTAVHDGYQFIPTTGGTGVTPRDLTPEGTTLAIDTTIPGISEMLRADGLKTIPSAVLTRGIAGVIFPTTKHDGALVVNMPGSPGGAKDGARLVHPLVKHIIDHIHGGGH